MASKLGVRHLTVVTEELAQPRKVFKDARRHDNGKREDGNSGTRTPKG